VSSRRCVTSNSCRNAIIQKIADSVNEICLVAFAPWAFRNKQFHCGLNVAASVRGDGWPSSDAGGAVNETTNGILRPGRTGETVIGWMARSGGRGCACQTVCEYCGRATL
jgi:hypothetical protein